MQSWIGLRVSATVLATVLALISCGGGANPQASLPQTLGPSIFTTASPFDVSASPGDYSRVIGSVEADPACLFHTPPCSLPSRVIMATVELTGPVRVSVLSRGDRGFSVEVQPGHYTLRVLRGDARFLRCPSVDIDVPARHVVMASLSCTEEV